MEDVQTGPGSDQVLKTGYDHILKAGSGSDQKPRIRIQSPDFRQWSEYRSVGTRGGEGRGVTDAQREAPA